MSGGREIADGIVARRRNAVASWILVACLTVAAGVSASDGDLLWAGLGLAAVAVTVVPAVAYRRWTATLPWEVSLFVALPYALQSLDLLLPRSVATYLVVPALALAVAVEFDAFTAVEMSPGFAVVFVVTATMAAAGAWAVVRWVADLAFGTRNLRGLYHVMWSMAAATGVGVVAGVAFAAYFRRVDRERLGFSTGHPRERSAVGASGTARPRSSGDARSESGETATESAGRLRLSDRRQRQVVRGLQLALVVVLAVGLVRRSVGVVVNAAVALAVMELPGLLERDYGLPIDAGLTLWIVVPVFLHALGSFGLYEAIGLWDNLTHTLSSSLVAAAGYATVRAFDVHDADVYFPRKFVAAFILVFTMAFGVLWELLEFGIDGFASQTGVESILAQHGLANTMTDLVFDCFGAVVVAVWGGAYLAGVSRSLADRLAADGESE
ncbi:hypothetical protein [Halorussus aquaticus]|uniref:Uncharacterized protein n=1 Tax=Halorussus aquaticus TaxID=2953748 RepID=A0ABD5PZE3_9EURY|nr:hypothetical protein [Halorussus aquaticus]